MKEIILIKQLNETIKKDIINLLKKFGLSTCKKINFITLFSWDIAKILHSCCFEYFRYTWPRPTLMFIYTKNQLRPSILSWDISKILQSCHFECFGYDWPCPRKLTESTCAKVWYLSARKNELHTLFSWDIAKISQTCYYAYFGDAWLWPPKTMVSACIAQKIKFIPRLFLEILLILQTCFFCYVGHACPHPPKTIWSTCRKLWCLPTCKKST